MILSEYWFRFQLLANKMPQKAIAIENRAFKGDLLVSSYKNAFVVLNIKPKRAGTDIHLRK